MAKDFMLCCSHRLVYRGGLVIYFHGNAGNLQRWGEIAGCLTLYNYHVLVADYRGYGKSTGKPTEGGLYADADGVWKWATDNMPGMKYVIYGRSLGSAVASYLAQKVQPDLLILETPSDELRSVVHPVVRPLLRLIPLKYSFPTAQYLSRVQFELENHFTASPFISQCMVLGFN
jgi:fermentation-respiration switch protein FrsA (DUF1100 family)